MQTSQAGISAPFSLNPPGVWGTHCYLMAFVCTRPALPPFCSLGACQELLHKHFNQILLNMEQGRKTCDDPVSYKANPCTTSDIKRPAAAKTSPFLNAISRGKPGSVHKQAGSKRLARNAAEQPVRSIVAAALCRPGPFQLRVLQ